MPVGTIWVPGAPSGILRRKDASGNVSIGDVVCHDVERSYLHSTSRLVTAIGLREHIVVETADAVLAAPWDRLREVKPLAQKLKDASREEAISHRKVFRPWGAFETINNGNRFQVKRLTVKPGQAFHSRSTITGRNIGWWSTERLSLPGAMTCSSSKKTNLPAFPLAGLTA
jgi:hypothetical protein